MKNQIRIIVKGGAIQSVETNFHCELQILDYDNGDDMETGIYTPDLVNEGKNILNTSF